MKVVSISLDPDILNPQSRVSARNLFYGEAVSSYRVLVHHHKNVISERPHNVTVYGVGGSSKALRLFRILLRVRRFIKQGECDVISSSDPYFIGLGTLLLAKRYGVGFELNIFGIEKLTSLRKLLARFVVRHAGSVRVNSMHLRQYVAETFGIPVNSILFVPTTYVPGKLGLSGLLGGSKEAEVHDSAVRTYKETFGSAFNLLSVGRLVPVKDHELQLKALKALTDDGKDVHLHIVGDGPFRAELENRVRELGLADVVTFYGALDEPTLGALYHSVNAYLLTSKFEGWPMSVFDAILANVPIVMTEVGCAGELIHDHEQGLIVPIGDTEALTEAIRNLMRDASLGEKLTAAAQTSFQNYWSLDKILAGYKQSWERAVGAARH